MKPSIKTTVLQSVALSIAITAAIIAATHCEARADASTPVLRTYAGVAMDTTVVGKLGIERDLAAPRADVMLATPLVVTLPVLGPGGGDVDVRAGLRAELRRGRFAVAATASPLVRTMSSTYYSIVALGVDLELAPTVTLGRAAVGLELGHDRTFAERFSHTQAYRDRYYADVHDGWYAGSASRLRAGLRGEVRVTRALALRARGGVNASTAGAPDVVPLYAELGAALAF